MRGIDELDHYELLEIKRGASRTEIDRAYRLAQQTYAEGSLALYSVFESADAAVLRKRFDEAYRILADPELRADYDAGLPRDEVVDPTQRPGWQTRELGSGGNGSCAGEEGAADAARPLDPLDAYDAFDSVENAVREYDAIEDDGRGEFDGVRLRRNRLFRGYEIDDISDVTKVSPTHLRNIEEENFLDLPADVYVRGFVTAYAQTIGLDPNVVVPSYMARVQESRRASQRGGFLARQ